VAKLKSKFLTFQSPFDQLDNYRYVLHNQYSMVGLLLLYIRDHLSTIWSLYLPALLFHFLYFYEEEERQFNFIPSFYFIPHVSTIARVKTISPSYAVVLVCTVISIFNVISSISLKLSSVLVSLVERVTVV